ncbi:MAG: hypothetical protein ACP5IZ_11875 [Thermoprotei archaeon]
MRFEFILPKVGRRGGRIKYPVMITVFGNLVTPGVEITKRTKDYVRGYYYFPIPDAVRILMWFEGSVDGISVEIPAGLDDIIVQRVLLRLRGKKFESLFDVYRTIRKLVTFMIHHLRRLSHRRKLFIISWREHELRQNQLHFFEDRLIMEKNIKDLEAMQQLIQKK